MHKVRDYKRKAKLDFRLYDFFCAEVMSQFSLEGGGGICVLCDKVCQ